MFGSLLLVIMLGSCAVCAVLGFRFAFRVWRHPSSYDSEVDVFAGVGGGVAAIALGLFVLTMVTGEFHPVPPGCYRISTSTSTGVVSTGKTIVPIVISGYAYEPIPCP